MPRVVTGTRHGRATGGPRRARRALAGLGVTALAALGAACGDDGGNAADNFTDRPGQNAPTGPADNSSTTVTTTGDGGMGGSGDDTSGQVGK
ncbi:MAG TPA: hypothetical protein VFS16_02455 [Acidimicrobiia bacterium]|nr:hypothetical protein [Acidimicrobiia bacterium]